MGKLIIAVSGANGQVGWELHQLSKSNQLFEFIFLSRNEMNLSDETSIKLFFDQYKVDYFVNAAAYTQVDLAEDETELSTTINSKAVSIISKICFEKNIHFIHFSTDYVFNGEGETPFKETDVANPINFYGQTKLNGEIDSLKNNPNSIIIRTSWVYSSHGKNFVKTMLRLMNEKEEISVVNDQVGCPTFAGNLAEAVLKICSEIERGNKHTGIYHYSNQGIISWFQFASAIKEIKKLDCKLNAISTNEFPTKAKRPKFSALNTQKIQKDFNIEIPFWKDSLKKCLESL